MPKPGYITASAFNNIMTASYGKTVQKYACRIACERLGVKYLDEQYDLSYVYAIQWGNENESLAIAEYEAQNFVSVHSKQVFQSIPGTLIGGTPDGLVGDDGGVDAKCPSSENHLMNISQDEQVSDYYDQFQAYMWITGRKWWDLASYDPRFPDDLQLHVNRVLRDESRIDAIRKRAEEVEAHVRRMLSFARPGCVFDPTSCKMIPQEDATEEIEDTEDGA